MLVKPILTTEVAFDKNDGNLFTFVSIGGDTVVKNKLTIRKNNTNDVVYEKTITTTSFEHQLTSNNNLSNGVEYNAIINTYNSNDDESESSNMITFYCYSNPTFEFVNKPTNNIVGGSTFNFSVKYEQDENQLLNSAYYVLYNSSQESIFQSQNIYANLTPPSTTSYLMTGLVDDTNYYIKAFGLTKGGTTISTSLYSFAVDYSPISFSTNFMVENDAENGVILIKNSLTGSSASTSNIAKLKVKRREIGASEWVDVIEKSISTVSDFVIDTIDIFAPSMREFEYALVPTLSDGTESVYITKTVYSLFKSMFVKDMNNSFKLLSNVNHQRNRKVQKGVLQPIGARTPFVISNSDVNYKEGSVSANLLGRDFYDTRQVAIKNVFKEAENFTDFITNSEIKVVKDWSGDICICLTTSDISYPINLSTGVASVSFNYVEQGRYDEQETVIEFGMVRYL